VHKHKHGWKISQLAFTNIPPIKTYLYCWISIHNIQTPSKEVSWLELNQLPKKEIVLLTYMFSLMLQLSYFPIRWKYSTIRLILKRKKPPDYLSSYRPISLLPILSKIFGKILLKKILNIILEKKSYPKHNLFSAASTSQSNKFIEHLIKYHFLYKKNNIALVPS